MRIAGFGMLVLVAAALAFMQLGFVPIGTSEAYVAQAMMLLAPAAVGSLLLGPAVGAACGAACGVILLAHARILPGSVHELYFTTPVNTVVLLCGAAFLTGLLFSILLRENGNLRRGARIAVACLVVAMLCSTVSQALEVGMLQGYEEVIRVDLGDEWFDTTSMRYQALLNSTHSNMVIRMAAESFVMAFPCIAVDLFVRHLLETAQTRTMRTAFRLYLVTALVMAFLVVSSAGAIALTRYEERNARRSMHDELKFLTAQLQEISRLDGMVTDAYQKGRDIGELELFTSLVKLVEGYQPNVDGTILILSNHGGVLYMNNHSYYMGMDIEEALGNDVALQLEDMCETGKIIRIPIAELSPDDKTTEAATAQLAYLSIARGGDYRVVRIVPYSVAYADRLQTMVWICLVALVLLVTLYFALSRALDTIAGQPLRRTLASLEAITKGDLEVTVQETSTVESSMLSAGINSTVVALKGWIDEAERRMESELDAARSIQEGALPRCFPAFPGIDAVDFFALMEPARVVGGDFYDYFAISKDVIGFLIADVSGKGIPASLFMMAAKNEIQNCMCAGMALAEAIAVANNHICAVNDANMFVTVWAATLNWRTGELVFVNAGHNLPLLRHNGYWRWTSLRGDFVMGGFEGMSYRSQTIMLELGDELLLYTDGVNEAFNKENEWYGNDRLESFLAEHPDLHPEELAHALRADVARWAQGAEQSDDVTILAMEYRGN